MRYTRAGRDVRRIALDAEQELRAREDALQRRLDAALERPVAPADLIEVQQRLQIGVGHRLPIGAARQRRENLPRARRLRSRARLPGRPDERRDSTKIRRRLGVSPGPVALNGPVMVSDLICGRPVQSSVSTELRRNGCSRAVSASGEVLDERRRPRRADRPSPARGPAAARRSRPPCPSACRTPLRDPRRRRWSPRWTRSPSTVNSTGAGTRGRARCPRLVRKSLTWKTYSPSSGNVWRTSMPPSVPSGRPSMCWSCERSCRTR